MKRRRVRFDRQTVFLKVPFDLKYERLFISMIAAVVSLGRTPGACWNFQRRAAVV